MARKFFIITGISGAGKSQALKCFEDFGYFCVDNMPLELIDRFAKLSSASIHKRVALGMDIREGKTLTRLPDLLRGLRAKGIDYRVLFLDASNAAVIHRFSETRHRHPLGIKIEEAVREERERLLPIKEIADKVIDTSDMTLGELKEALSRTLELTRTKEMTLSVVSFGYKFGIPMDADIVMDVRFLPNPNYVASMKKLTGLNARVQRYILKQPAARRFLEEYLRLIESLLPQYVREGKSYLTIAIGCTGGHHRSVFIARYLAEKLRGSGHPIMEFHRDIDR